MVAFPIANMFNVLLAANIVFSFLIVGKVHAVDNNSGLYKYEKSAIPNRTFSDEGKGFTLIGLPQQLSNFHVFEVTSDFNNNFFISLRFWPHIFALQRKFQR